MGNNVLNLSEIAVPGVGAVRLGCVCVPTCSDYCPATQSSQPHTTLKCESEVVQLKNLF